MLAVTVVRGKYWRQRAPMRRLAIAQEMDFLHARLWCIILLSKQRKRLLQPKKCAFCRARRSSSPRCPSRMFVHGVVEPHPTQDDFPYPLILRDVRPPPCWCLSKRPSWRCWPLPHFMKYTPRYMSASPDVGAHHRRRQRIQVRQWPAAPAGPLGQAPARWRPNVPQN